MRIDLRRALCMASLVCLANSAEAKDREFEPRPILGIKVIDIAPGLEDVVGLKTHRGAYVVEGNGSPPQRSGEIPKDVIMEGDLIVGIGETPILSTRDISGIVRAKKPGDMVKVKVLRAGEEIGLTIEIQAVPPLIYLPADVCPALTAGALLALDVPAMLFTGYPILGISPSDLGGQCRNVVPACTPLQLTKQTPKRTVIDINGFDHELAGDWRAHTHLFQQACLDEKAKLEALRAAEGG